jgi:hypothetical protein
MADSGDLGKLPPEIRKEIYSYLLVEDKRIVISRRKHHKHHRPLRMGSYRNANHTDSTYDHYDRKWTKAPPGIDALLLVNKLVSQEAAQVLYGLNHFAFEHSAALQTFLKCVGNSRQHLRHIALINEGVIYRYKWTAMDASLKLLLQAKSLRSFGISHIAFCGNYYGKGATCWRGDSATLIQHCKPLLESLKSSLEAQNLDTNILDVIKIELEPCYKEMKHGHLHKESHRVIPGRDRDVELRQTLSHTHNNSKSRPMHSWGARCNCVCRMAEEYNLALAKDLREEIAKQLGLSIEGEEQNEDAE